jgi:ribosomal protein S18 acetylase RimI-like enzyme
MVTPSFHTIGLPHFFSIKTDLDFGPSVTRSHLPALWRLEGSFHVLRSEKGLVCAPWFFPEFFANCTPVPADTFRKELQPRHFGRTSCFGINGFSRSVDETFHTRTLPQSPKYGECRAVVRTNGKPRQRRHADKLHIVYLAVSHAALQRQVGKQLLEYAKGVAKAEGRQSISLCVREQNLSAQQCFLSQGFSVENILVDVEADSLLGLGSSVQMVAKV